MEQHEQYHLRVTAGPSYDTSTHQLVAVNTSRAVHIQSADIDAHVTVRIKNYRGLPKDSPSTSPYFEHAPHTNDLYSIAFRFSLPSSSEQITADDLVFGNDFERPIRDHLPWGTSTALKIVKTAIDPGIDGDMYADKPHLYGPLFSSINTLSIDEPTSSTATSDPDTSALHEGGTGKGEALRKKHNVPADVGGRRKHFLTEHNRAEFSLTGPELQGLEYRCDFFNPYLDFNEFALKLPGFSLGIMKFWDGQPLRYVLKHRTKDGRVDKPLFVISFALVNEEEVEGEAEKWESVEKKEKSVVGYQDEGVD